MPLYLVDGVLCRCVSTIIRIGDVTIHALPLWLSLNYYKFVKIHHLLQALIYERTYFCLVEGRVFGDGKQLNRIYNVRPPLPSLLFHKMQMISTIAYLLATTVATPHRATRIMLQIVWSGAIGLVFTENLVYLSDSEAAAHFPNPLRRPFNLHEYLWRMGATNYYIDDHPDASLLPPKTTTCGMQELVCILPELEDKSRLQLGEISPSMSGATGSTKWPLSGSSMDRERGIPRNVGGSPSASSDLGMNSQASSSLLSMGDDDVDDPQCMEEDHGENDSKGIDRVRSADDLNLMERDGNTLSMLDPMNDVTEWLCGANEKLASIRASLEREEKGVVCRRSRGQTSRRNYMKDAADRPPLFTVDDDDSCMDEKQRAGRFHSQNKRDSSNSEENTWSSDGTRVTVSRGTSRRHVHERTAKT